MNVEKHLRISASIHDKKKKKLLENLESSFLNLIKTIDKIPAAKIKLNSERLNDFLLKWRQGDSSHHSYSTLYLTS